jgi:hypothetical protein
MNEEKNDISRYTRTGLSYMLVHISYNKFSYPLRTCSRNEQSSSALQTVPADNPALHQLYHYAGLHLKSKPLSNDH